MPLARLVLVSRPTIPAGVVFGPSLQVLASQTREAHRILGVTGLLFASHHALLQVMEGDEAAVAQARRRVEEDARHSDVVVLHESSDERRVFGGQALGTIERLESSDETAARLARVRERLTAVPFPDANEWLELLSRSDAQDNAQVASPCVVFTSPRGLWLGGVAKHLDAKAPKVVNRTIFAHLGPAESEASIEMIDFESAELGPMRAVLTGGDLKRWSPLLAPLVSSLSLIVFLVSAGESRIADDHLQAFAQLPGQRAASVPMLLATSSSQGRVDDLLQDLAASGWKASPCPARPSDAVDLWMAASTELAKSHRPPAKTRPTKAAAAPKAAAQEAPAPAAETEPQRDPASARLVDALQGLPGFMGGCVVSVAPAAILEPVATTPEARLWLNVGQELIRLKHELVSRLDSSGRLEDVVISGARMLQLFRAWPDNPSRYLSVVIDRAAGNIAAARLKLQELLEPTG